MLEPIKVSVDVNVHLSEKTEQFILGLFSGKSVNNAQPAAPAAKPESKPAAPAASQSLSQLLLLQSQQYNI